MKNIRIVTKRKVRIFLGEKGLRNQLELQTNGHCSFCDGYPVGETSKESIEHFFPKDDYPLLAYSWDNLFFICDKCNSEANKIKFEHTLKPDQVDYEFGKYFYFDLYTGKLVVNEHLKKNVPDEYKRASKFLKRYGINTPKRNIARTHLFYDIQNFFNHGHPSNDQRQRNDFKYRYIFDLVVFITQLKLF